MTTPPDDHARCIYCREVRPPSREHILPRSLGGDLTTRDISTATPVVCGDCNQGFSPIDQALCERSFISLPRITYTDPTRLDTKLGGEHFHHDVDNDIWLEIEIRNHFRGRILPQLHRREQNIIFQAADNADRERFVSVLEKWRREARIVSTHIKVGPQKFCTTARLVQHRRDSFYVRASTLEDGEAFLATIDTKWEEILGVLKSGTPQESPREHPQITFNMSFPFNEIYRAIAKIAFNFMAAKKGGAFALRREFDSIRDYIRGLSLQPDAVVEPDDISVDGRFVSQLPYDQEAPVPTESHMLALFYSRPSLLGIVTLYRAVTFVVRLGELDLADMSVVAHEFSNDHSGNKELELEELFHRMRTRDETE